MIFQFSLVDHAREFLIGCFWLFSVVQLELTSLDTIETVAASEEFLELIKIALLAVLEGRTPRN